MEEVYGLHLEVLDLGAPGGTVKSSPAWTSEEGILASD